ncbi:hypothetical protein Lser_V15G26292 [Lactuca serriola]
MDPGSLLWPVTEPRLQLYFLLGLVLCDIPAATEEDVNVFVDAAHKALQISSRESIFNHGSCHTRTDTSNSRCFVVNACSKKPDQNIHLESKVYITVKYFNNEQFEADEHDKYLKRYEDAACLEDTM